MEDLPPSDRFWPENSQTKKSGSHLSSRKINDLNKFLSPLDDGADFHDPYSDLSLFLSQKIKEECKESGFISKWSLYLQEKLIAKISPEFQKKFPNYKLGVNTLRTLWKKIAYYSEQLGSQKEALTNEGKLNISFLIKENLKQYLELKSQNAFYPYQYAYQLAMKISDCVATLDGVRPLLDQLSKTIWFVQKHLLGKEALFDIKSPHDEIDKWDRLIIKTLLEVMEKNPQLTHKELEASVKEKLQSLQELPNLQSLDGVTAQISALLAEKLYPTSSFHTLYSHEEKIAAVKFIRKHILLYKKASTLFNLSECARRLSAFYLLASNIKEGDQSLTAFVSQETRLLEHTHPENLAQAIQEAFEETKQLPSLSLELLDMIIWKVLSKEENLLNNLPYHIGLKIEEEISYIMIDGPKLSFGAIVHNAVQFFRNAKELTETKNWLAIEKKTALWGMQGDLLCKWLHLDKENTLLKLICEKKRLSSTSHTSFISDITQTYLSQHPEQVAYAPQVAARAAILYKYAWYTHLASSTESSLERFLEWHLILLSPLQEEETLLQIEEICKKSIPLVPIDKEMVKNLFRRRQERLKEEVKAETNERHA